MTYLQLGRAGDLCNILPAMKWRADQSGEPCGLVVDVSGAPLLDGCSYVKTYPCPLQDYREIHGAMLWARKRGLRDIVVTQVRARSWHPAETSPSYALDSRQRCQVPDEAWTVPVLFDLRSPEREAALIARLALPDRPLVLFCASGHSSPFPEGPLLYRELRAAVPEAHWLDIGPVKAERLYDLLCLYDRAACLVTIDTATAHLAAARPTLPVVALISDRGRPWAGSIYLPTVNVVVAARYKQWRQAVPGFVEAVKVAVADRSLV